MCYPTNLTIHCCDIILQATALAARGGQNLKETVKRMMETMFTNAMCCIMNWTGSVIDADDDIDDVEEERV